MLKKIAIALLGLGLLVTMTAAVMAADMGNERKGKYLFRKNCRACHQDGASAPALSPDSKTQAQWERIFEKKKYEDFECAAEWAKLSDSDKADILAYTHGHAFDSPSPAKCK